MTEDVFLHILIFYAICLLNWRVIDNDLENSRRGKCPVLSTPPLGTPMTATSMICFRKVSLIFTHYVCLYCHTCIDGVYAKRPCGFGNVANTKNCFRATAESLVARKLSIVIRLVVVRLSRIGESGEKLVAVGAVSSWPLGFYRMDFNRFPCFPYSIPVRNICSGILRYNAMTMYELLRSENR